MIVVCLDDTKPVTRDEASWACWVGDGKNRFYDKHQCMRHFLHFRTKANCVVVIVFENGKSGFLGEHSCMDGTPTLRLNEFVLASLAAKKVDLGPPRTPETGKGLPPPRELSFVVNEAVSKHVKDAEIAFDALVGQHDMHVCAPLCILYSDSHLPS
jgi:carnitine O-acetyltransferase